MAREIPIANACEVESYAPDGGLYRMWFGETGTTFVYVWADSFESAFEESVEWIDDNAPGHLINLNESDLRAAAKDEGIAWQTDWPDWDDRKFQKVVEAAETDLTSIGHTTLKHGQYVASWEWGGDDITSPEEYEEIVERSYEECGDS